jgi:hypothetical protein
MVSRASAIQLLYDHVTGCHPQLLDAGIMDQLERSRATNSINAAVTVLQARAYRWCCKPLYDMG